MTTVLQASTDRQTSTVSSSTAARDFGVVTTALTPIVFVVDDDISVRESLELLVKHAGWQPLLFESPRHFLATLVPRFQAAWCWM